MDRKFDLRSLDLEKRSLTLFQEFKNFAFKGNLIELAIAVIIGAAFGKIIDSLVKSIIMPLLGVMIPSEHGYMSWRWVINGKEIPYGMFLGEVVNFLLVAMALFLFFVKFLGAVMRKKEAAPSPAPLTKEQELLTEIRDLLKQRAA